MRKRINKICPYLLLFCLLALQSCDYLVFKKKESFNKPLAKFKGKELFAEDVKDLVPNNLTKEDSTVLVKRIIDDWALQQILLQKAEENNSKTINDEIQKLVEEYKQSLLINRYKEELIKQELDTLITDQQIGDYYDSNKHNFRLNEELLQIRYISFGEDLLDKKNTIKAFKSGSIEDLEDLESKQLSFKTLMLNDSTWVTLNNVLKETVFLRDELLKKSELVQKEDSINLFLAVVKNVLLKNEIAPKQFIEQNIKQILLHKRKLEVIREIENILLKDAIKNKQLTYK